MRVAHWNDEHLAMLPGCLDEGRAHSAELDLTTEYRQPG